MSGSMSGMSGMSGRSGRTFVMGGGGGKWDWSWLRQDRHAGDRSAGMQDLTMLVCGVLAALAALALALMYHVYMQRQRMVVVHARISRAMYARLA